MLFQVDTNRGLPDEAGLKWEEVRYGNRPHVYNTQVIELHSLEALMDFIDKYGRIMLDTTAMYGSGVTLAGEPVHEITLDDRYSEE